MKAPDAPSAEHRPPGAPPAEPGWRAERFVRLALTLALATAAGAAAAQTAMPLPWMLGPLFACGTASALGARLVSMPMGRELGQVAVGLAVGMRFTAAVLAATLALLPAMAAATVFVIVVTTVGALIFAPLARVDGTTAFFATAAGGMADMAWVAQERGGDPGAVSVVHAIRVTTVVATVPFLVFAFGVPGTAAETRPDASDSLILLALALVLAYATARAMKPLPLPNPWLVGPIFLGAVLGSSEILVVDVPWSLIVVAQIMIGTWLGCRFRREVLSQLPRVAAAGFAVALYMVAAAAAGAHVMAQATGLPFATSFLALAPAAVTEMVITAKAMNIDAEIVTAFHVMRISVIASSVLLVYALYQKLAPSRPAARP